MNIIELNFYEDKGDNMLEMSLLEKKVLRIVVKEEYFKMRKKIEVEQEVDMSKVLGSLAGNDLKNIIGGGKKNG